MKLTYLAAAIIVPAFLIGQSSLNVTGRISFRTLQNSYKENSDIKPDSIPDKDYAKTFIVPGFEQRLNMAVFARTPKLDLTFLSDIRNNQWDQLNSINRIERLTLSARFDRNEIVLGDFFDSGSEFFVQSREVRGVKADLRFSNLWNRSSYLQTKITGGQVQRPYGIGARLPVLYHQYENAGQYRRWFTSALVRLADEQRFDIALKYLYAADDTASVNEALNEPLTNQTAGMSGSLYLWEKHIQLFAEGYLSKKDTLSAKNISDHAYKGGFDFRYEQFKLLAYYQRLGYDYYSAGYPFLQNDRQGFKFVSAFRVPQIITFSVDGEQYDDNLGDDASRPVTTARLAETGFTTHFKNLPELTLKWRYRDDNSNTILDTIKTDKISRGLEAGLSYGFDSHRFSLSTYLIDLDDRSVLSAGSPLGTSQFIASFNFYTRPAAGLFISGGSVLSTLELTNKQENRNMYNYLSGRWDLMNRKLKLEWSLSYTLNDAENGGNQDLVSNYNQLGSEFSIEYFFTNNVSAKLIGGNDRRSMAFSMAEALEVIADPDYGPLFFNGYEDYDNLKYGMELNWIF